MNFDTLKTKCARHFYNNTFDPAFWGHCALVSASIMSETGKLNKYREIPDKVRNDAYNAIMRTDIRNVKALSESFPSIVPNWIKYGHYAPELTDNGWELIKIETD